MLKSEVAKILAFAQGADRRQINELSVEVWHELIGELPYDRAMDAVRGHYREESRPIYPADIRDRAGVNGDDDTQWMLNRS